MKRLSEPRPGRPRAVLDVQCGRCGHVHGVTSAEVLRGVWRACPACDAPADAVRDAGQEAGDGG